MPGFLHCFHLVKIRPQTLCSRLNGISCVSLCFDEDYCKQLFSRLFIFEFCLYGLFRGDLFSRTAELDYARKM